MKKITIILLSVSSMAFAKFGSKSRVGEWAAYEYVEKTATKEIKGQLIKEVLQTEDKLLPSGEKVTLLKISEKLITNGRTQNEKFFWDEDTNHFTKFELNLYVQMCRFQLRMGSFEKITVKAGNFSACKIKDQESWIGAVPFSTLLYVSNDGTTFKRFELLDYGWKKKE